MADITGIITLDQLLGNEYFLAAAIFVASLIIAKIVNIVLRTWIKRLTERTKSDLDDLILKAAIGPMDFLIVSIGLYFAFKRLTLILDYAAYVDTAFLIICVMIGSLIVSRVFSVLINHWLRVQKKYEQTPKLISKIVAVVVYLIAILAILGYYKIEITPVIAALGLGGLAIGLALQDTLSNFFAGLHIITDRPISVGDFIELEGAATVTGTVEDISWRSTRVRTPANSLVIVPNAKLASSIIINASPENMQDVTFKTDCGVAYGSDLKKVERVVLEVAKHVQKTVPGASKKAEPGMSFTSFGDSNINFSVFMGVEKYRERFLVRHELIKALNERFEKEKIEISWPVRKIYYGEKRRRR